jgi:hypothetical protein
MYIFRLAMVGLAALACSGCGPGGPNPSAIFASQNQLPPGASFLQPLAGGVSTARLYAATYSKIGTDVTAYNLLPLCHVDFEKSSELKGLTSSLTQTYGDLTISEGVDAAANLTGPQLWKFVNAAAGASVNQRVAITLTDAKLYQADSDGVAAAIAEYLKARGHGPPDSPTCLDVVQQQLKAGRMVIVTRGILTASKATIAPDSGASNATCQAASSSGTAAGAAGGAGAGGAAGGTGTGGAAAPISACTSFGVGKIVNISVKGQSGVAINQEVEGAVYAIIPDQLSL